MDVRNANLVIVNDFLDGFELNCIPLDTWFKNYNYTEHQANQYRNEIEHKLYSNKFFERDGLDRIYVAYDILNNDVYYISKIRNNGLCFVICDDRMLSVLKRANMLSDLNS